MIFPKQCLICGKVGYEICSKCYRNIKCFRIKKNKVNSENVLSLYRYEKLIRLLVLNYKFNNQSYLYKFFSNCFINNKITYDFLKSYDIIMPIPLHRKKYLKRGYNQTELIANEIGKILNKKVVKYSLIKVKETKAQSTISFEERITNVVGSFKVVNENKIKDKKILLIDDVYTTGSTFKECRKVLKKAGAGKVGILTIAKNYITKEEAE